MTVYGGFAPGTYQAWALNLLFNSFGTSGIVRGLGVTAPGGMQVTVGVDATALDGVCYLPNGAFLRIDTATTFSVAANNTGNTRTDAVVAQVDPSGSLTTQLSYVTNWSNAFAPGVSTQFVVALVSVANGALSITSGNITMNSATASMGGAGGGGSSSNLTDADGVGIGVSDNSTTSILTLRVTGLTTNVGRGVAIQATDTSGIGHYFYFNTDDSTILPGMLGATGVSTSGTVYAAGISTNGPIYASVVHSVADSASNATTAASATTSTSVTTVRNGSNTSVRLYTGTSTPSSPATGAIWVKA